jgi:hypothetical protein
MLGLIEGLCGVADAPGTTALSQLVLSPRWAASDTQAVAVTARYAASDGYVAYRYRHDPAARTLTCELTGKSAQTTLRLLLPSGVTAARQVTGNGQPLPTGTETIEKSTYVVATIDTTTPLTVVVTY